MSKSTQIFFRIAFLITAAGFTEVCTVKLTLIPATDIIEFICVKLHYFSIPEARFTEVVTVCITLIPAAVLTIVFTVLITIIPATSLTYMKCTIH